MMSNCKFPVYMYCNTFLHINVLYKYKCIVIPISLKWQVQLLNGEKFPVNFKNPKDYENLQNKLQKILKSFMPLWNHNGMLSAYLADIKTLPGKVFMKHTHV